MRITVTEGTRDGAPFYDLSTADRRGPNAHLIDQYVSALLGLPSEATGRMVDVVDRVRMTAPITRG